MLLKLSTKLNSEIQRYAIGSIYRLNCPSCIYYGYTLYKIKNRISWEGEYLTVKNGYDYYISLV